MKKQNFTSCLIVLLVLATTLHVFGGPAMQVKLTGHGLGTTPGGEFLFTTFGIPGHTDGSILKTFCLETKEFIKYNVAYDVVISSEAISGGNNYGPAGVNGGDPIDPMTAYLFFNYQKGTLVGWSNDDASADALQTVIWGIEDELGQNWLPPSGSLEELFYGQAWMAVYGPEFTWTGLGPVRVMNLYSIGYSDNDDTSFYRQDQLVLVPSPGAVFLGCIGLMLVGLLRKRVVC